MNDFSLISGCLFADSGTLCCTGLLFPFNADGAARYRNAGDKYLCFLNYAREAPLISFELGKLSQSTCNVMFTSLYTINLAIPSIIIKANVVSTIIKLE